MPKYKILIVDDLIDNLKIMVNVFEDHFKDCNIYQTSDSRKVLDICKKTNPDIVVTDWKMPFISGIELTKQLKNDLKTQHIPVIITTAAMINPTDMETALNAGAIDFIVKPFNTIELIARVKSAIESTQHLIKSIEYKDKELAENTIQLLKNKSFATEVEKLLLKLETEVLAGVPEAMDTLNKLKQITKAKVADDSFERFNIAFYSMHEDFNKNILSQFPNLTKSELKLAAFLKLGLSSKDIASALYQTVDSVKVSRFRLRKKINLKKNQNLEIFLSSF